MNIKKIVAYIGLCLIIVSGIYLRAMHLNFGLPHTFPADEPEISELAIKYTFEFKKIIANKDYYQLIPINFVYGTVPTYILTFLVMTFSKLNNLLNNTFSKEDLYVFMRSINLFVGLLFIPAITLLSKKLTRSNFVAIFVLLLSLFSWKFIVHSHYVNGDIWQTTFLIFSALTLYLYFEKNTDTLFTVLTGVFFGLAVGTKITSLITFPLYIYFFTIKKDYRGLFAFSFIVFGTFMASNPFSFILADKFAFRILQMFTKEGGMVFDSIDLSPLKYMFALNYLLTFPILLISLFGIFKSKILGKFNIYILGNIIVYLIFFSLQSRRVDRWMLPILPLFFLYTAVGLYEIKKYLSNFKFGVIFIILGIIYLYYPYLLTLQFQRHTPKGQAYIWLQENTKRGSNILAFTEEGLDPINKIQSARVVKINVYSNEAAQFQMPDSPLGYDYVVISSKPMRYFKNKYVKEKYPFYSSAWQEFENTLNDPNNFEVVKEFTLPKPNLIELSDVVIYRKTL